jgi:hypothetical protein
MKRGGILFAVLTVAASLLAQPARAVEPPLVVDEISRTAADGQAEVPFYVLAHTDGRPGIVSFIQLAPRKGGGWTQSRFSLVMYDLSDTHLTAYAHGTTLPSVGCPAPEDICGKNGTPGDIWLPFKFRPAAGNRYFVAGPPDDFRVYTMGSWRTRQVALGARLVTTATADAVGTVAAGRRVEAFYSATAPGGKYGSGVFAMAPCRGDNSVGTATVKSDGTDKAATISCKPGGYYAAFSTTLDGRTWTVTGPVVGEYRFPYRLLVLDYPKR